MNKLFENEPNFRSNWEKNGFLSYLHMAHTLPYFLTVSRKGADKVTIDDLPGLGKTERIEHNLAELKKNYNDYKQGHPNASPSFIIPLLKTLKKNFLLEIFYLGAQYGLRFTFGWFLYQLILDLSNPFSSSSDAFSNAGIIFALLILSLYFAQHSLFNYQNLNTKCKSLVIGIIYEKITQVSLHSLRMINIGKVINIVANDINCLDSVYYITSLCLMPLTLAGGIALLWQFFGVHCLVGIGTLIFFIPIQIILIGKTKKPRQERNKLGDKRVRITNELIEGIRLLKMYAWEINFMDMIMNIRKQENGKTSQIMFLEFVQRGIALSSLSIAPFLIVISYYLSGHELSVGLVFTVLLLLNLVGIYGVLHPAAGIGGLIEIGLLFKRIIEILELSETKMSNSNQTPRNSANAIEYEDYSAYWASQDLIDKRPTLHDINLEIPKHSFTAIIGKVGSGKSTLLMSLLQEIPKFTGNVRFNSKISLVEQEPMIFSGTIRENILFGLEYSKDWYKKVVDAACLLPDFKQFPSRDFTEIGERGITLSGGQKARVALARAIYSNADIILLDDPLSAVDAKVAHKIYKKGIAGLLKEKTVILVTHQVHFIKDASKIVIMEDGRIEHQGTFQELQESGVNINQMLEKKNHEPEKSFSFEASRELEMESIHLAPKIEISDIKLYEEEDTQEGTVTWDTYKEFIKAGFTKWLLIGQILAFLFSDALYVGFGRILGFWGGGKIDNNLAIALTGSIVLLAFVFYVIKVSFHSKTSIKASQTLHNRMLQKLTLNKAEFFDKNPVGRILNRFSNDMGVIDNVIPATLMDVYEGLGYSAQLQVTAFVFNPYLIIPGACMIILLLIMIKSTTAAVVRARQLHLVTRSPLYSLFSQSISGLITVRSFNQSDFFKKKFSLLLNDFMRTNYTFYHCSRVQGLLFSYAAAFNVILGMCLIIITRHKFSIEDIGQSAVYLLILNENLQHFIRQGIFTSFLMASVARCVSYIKNNQPEAPLKLPADRELIKIGWPLQGHIKFNHVFMKYRKDTHHVIKNLTFEVEPGERIGCVGRTGAGKSSLLQILFRMVEIDEDHSSSKTSSVEIDNVDIKTIGLHLLRSNISIIPQTSFIFLGTIRRNLDPFSKYSDHQLYEALQEVNLKTYIDSLENKLDTEISIVDEIFSVGQKQLICLARAILSRSKIVVLDEATANVDFETDTFVQKKIKEKLRDSTIFTIAHRLTTVADYDKILVMDNGELVEYDIPYKLLVNQIGDKEITNKTGAFASMVLNTGRISSEKIFQVCETSYFSAKPRK